MRKPPGVPQLNAFRCLSAGSSFSNGTNPLVSMSLKVLKFYQEESDKVLCTTVYFNLKQYEKNLSSPRSTTLLPLSSFIKHIPYYLHSSCFQFQGHCGKTARYELKMTNSDTGTCQLLNVYAFQPTWGFQSSSSYWQSDLENYSIPSNNEYHSDGFLKSRH